MRFIVFLKSTAQTESGAPADPAIVQAMRAYNVRLRQAGVLLGGEFLKSSAEGVRLKIGAEGPSVTKGPFADPDTLIAGFWVFNCSTLQDAIGWAGQAPLQPGVELEIRPLLALAADGRIKATQS